MPSAFCAFVRFSVITTIPFEAALLPLVVPLFCSTTSVRLCGFVSTFHRSVVCLRSVHTDEPWCFRTPLLWLASCPFHLALRAWWQHRCSRVVFVFVRRVLSFSLPPFLYLDLLVFPRRFSLVYHWRPIDSPRRSHIVYQGSTLPTIGVALTVHIGPT